MTKGMESFFTREKANDGVEVPLYLPDGTKSEHWVRIRGVDSDAFRMSEAEAKRKGMTISLISDPAEKAQAISDAKLWLVASLVMSWSFEEEMTPEALISFLTEAPQIADAINQVASKRSLFFAQGSSSSQNTPAPSSN